MVNNQCVCSTSGAIVLNGVCECAINQLNVSNTCICPSGATLQSGQCICSVQHQYISNDICVCPQYSNYIVDHCECNVIAGQIMSAGQCVCSTTNAIVSGSACTCGVNGVNSSNTCSCPANSVLVTGNGGICVCSITGQTIQSGACQCPASYTVVNNICKKDYIINSLDSLMICSQTIFVVTFDIISVTNIVSSSTQFSSGYVFNSATIIQNAFIDISNNVYTPIVKPLFQSQTLYQLIKIQIGTQTGTSGPIVSNKNSITINKLNIISKSGCSINASSSIYILVPTSISTIINDLMINLSFSMQTGNISLINTVNGVINISNYQILGKYQSQKSVAMLGLLINTSNLNVNDVNFMVETFNVGNYSSYLMNSVNTSTVIINNIVIKLGNLSNSLISNAITATTTNTYNFGGIINYLRNSSLNIDQLLFDCYQTFNVMFMNNSGIILGNVNQSQNIIQISKICFQQLLLGTTQYNSFGLIGLTDGNISFINAQITFNIYSTYIYLFGIIGYSTAFSTQIKIINTRSIVKTNINSGPLHSYIAALIGETLTQISSIINSTITDCNITSQNCAAGLIGLTYTSTSQVTNNISNITVINCNITSINMQVGGLVGYIKVNLILKVFNTTIKNSNITTTQYAGGFVGISNSTQFQISNSTIQTVKIVCTSSPFGIIVGQQSSATYNVTTSKSISNQINGVAYNCASLTNIWTVGQC
ncbi:Conserved_hypothetical protein [Hexamita inflata]|uniref:Uncharacterized protein n=1 Tax=Hexamita inflata TaxID=28002 RepID=A0AA86V5H1_9EUKA|nr:Conserved hypothetical protein [Hexamita inflata]